MSAQIIPFPVERRKPRPANEMERLLSAFIERMDFYRQETRDPSRAMTKEEAKRINDHFGKLIR